MAAVKKMSINLALVLSAFAFVSTSAIANATTCATASAQTVVSKDNDFLIEKLKDIPTVQSFIQKMIADPLVPKKIKRILEVSLHRSGVSVNELTYELKQAMGLRSSVQGIQISKNAKYRLKHNDGIEESRNQANSSSINVSDVALNEHTVFVENRYPVNSRENAVGSLIHELAHVRFEIFIENNLETLLKRLPVALIQRASDGTVEINGNLHEFLHERYAFESQFEALNATEGRTGYFPGIYSMLGFPMNQENFRELISDFVIRRYRIYDPLVLALEHESIADIVSGKSFRPK